MVATGINKGGGGSLWCGLPPFVVVWWHFHVAGWTFEEILQHLKTLKRFCSLLWWLALCVYNACLSGLECLWMYWKGKEASWKKNIITQLSGKGTVESWLFGLVGPAQFGASGRVCNLVPFLGQWQRVSLWASQEVSGKKHTWFHWGWVELSETGLSFGWFKWRCVKFFLKASTDKITVFEVKCVFLNLVNN